MSQNIIGAFSAGEISPGIDSSTELEKYRYGLKECTNMIVNPLGGVKNRPGTQYITDCYNTAKRSRLIPFQFNTEQVYMLEFSHLRMRVIVDGALVLRDIVDSALYKWTASGSGTDEYYMELLAGGDPGLLETTYVLEDGVKMVEGTVGSLAVGETVFDDNDTLGYNTRYVRITGGVDPDTKSDGYLQMPVLIATPFASTFPSEEFVLYLDYTSSGDTLYISSGTYTIYKLTRSSDVDWTITAVPLLDGPYKARVPLVDSEVSINATYVSGDSWAFVSKTPIFEDVRVGESIRLGFPVAGDLAALYWSWFIVTIKSTSSSITADVQGDKTVVKEQILNNDFTDGLTYWTDITPTVSSGAKLTYDKSTFKAVLTETAGGEAKMEQSILTFPYVGHKLIIDVILAGADVNNLNIRVGTTSGGDEILGAITITTTGVYIYDVMPTASVIYLNMNTNGSTSGVVVTFNLTSLTPTETLVASNTEHSTNEWRLAEFNSLYDYPKGIIFSGQRLIPFNNKNEPQTIWFSRLGDYERHGFSTPSNSIDAFSIIPATSQLNGILSMVEHNGLKAISANEIWSIFSSTGGAVTPSDVNVKVVSSVGSLDLKPLVIGNSLIMTPRGHEAVSELTASNEAEGYVPRDISILASHLFDDRRVTRWVYARNPDSVIWCILDNGELLGLTYKKEYDVWAWHRHTTPLGEGFKDIAIIPNSSDDNIDEVYFVINRAELGETPNYYIEKLNKRITSQTAAFGLSSSGTPYDYKFLDSALTSADALGISGATKADPVVITSTAHTYINGDFIRIQNVIGMTELNNVVYKIANKAANTYELNDKDDNAIDGTGFTTYLTGGESRKMITVISGLDHLEGETVSALADGRVQENLVVSSGSVTLSQSASFIHIGLPYQSKIETVDLELLTQQGSSQGNLKSITKTDIYFKDTRQANCAAGSNPDEIRPIEFQSESFGETPPPLFNGVKETAVPGIPLKEETLIITQDKPLPIYIKRIVADVNYER